MINGRSLKCPAAAEAATGADMIDEETRAKWEAWRKRARTHLDLAERAAQIGYWRYDLRSGAYYLSLIHI